MNEVPVFCTGKLGGNNRGPLNFNMSVTPLSDSLIESQIVVSNVNSSEEANLTVDDEDFPMVSEVDLKLSLNRTFIKGTDFNSGIFQISQVSSGNSRSDGVTHDGDSHPFFCLLLQKIKKHFSCVIYAEDIELENDVTFGLFDCSHHFRI